MGKHAAALLAGLLVLAVPAAAQKSGGDGKPTAALQANLRATLTAMTPEQRKAALASVRSEKHTVLEKLAALKNKLNKRSSRAGGVDATRQNILALIDDTAGTSDTLSMTEALLQDGILPSGLYPTKAVYSHMTATSYPIWLMCAGSPWYFNGVQNASPTSRIEASYRKEIESNAEVIRKTARATGLISVYPGAEARGQPLLTATAVALGGSIVLTNNHVLAQSRFAKQNGNSWQMQKAVKIEFPLEYLKCSARSSVLTLRVRAVIRADYDLDLAVLETDQPVAQGVSFDAASRASIGDKIAVIGYPRILESYHIVLAPAEQRNLYRGPDNNDAAFPAERLAYGIVLQNSGTPESDFAHSATTLESNSGSAVIDLTTNKVAGLHANASGNPENDETSVNTAIKASTIAAFLEGLR